MTRARKDSPSEPRNARLDPLVLTKVEVAHLLQVSTDTVENLHRTGQLRGVMIGKHLRWRPDDVQQFVQDLRPGE